jgi:SAM-dependent MidA family methyltransferase
MIEAIPNSSALSNKLRVRIRNEGPITFYDWMKTALYDSEDGYYCRSDQIKWGREGDYRTSPERSSLFAATFARYFSRLYDQLGRPGQWKIVEAGGGDGQFANGLLQTLQQSFPDIFAATSYVINEVSPSSRDLARERLHIFEDRVHFRKLDDVEINPGVVFSNELLDAFPIHRIALRNGELKEFYVAFGENGDFEWLLDAPSPTLLPRLERYFQAAGFRPGEGQIADVNLEIEDWLQKVADKMATGYLVTVDYGATAEDLYSPLANQSGTLRGFHRHQIVDNLLARPGEQDLTTTVNWSFVKSVGARLGLELVEFERQDKFLLAAGFLEQLAIASQQCQDDFERLRLRAAAREMILPDGMASHFQVLVQRKTL